MEQGSPVCRFERLEQKYLLDPEQAARVEALVALACAPDVHPPAAVLNVYYDTPDFALIRRSCEKPGFKEKLRVRAYNVPREDDLVFVELKKKLAGVVYKRRRLVGERACRRWLGGGVPLADPCVVSREVEAFAGRYGLGPRGLAPRAFVGYDRRAFVGEQGLRLTFDRNLRWRASDLALSAGDAGEPLLAPGFAVLEVKALRGVPPWLCRALAAAGALPRSFSKYGRCYQERIAPTLDYRALATAPEAPRVPAARLCPARV